MNAPSPTTAGQRLATGAARIAGLVLIAALAACAREQAPAAAVVLVTLDTVRADALGCYGGSPGVTPNLDRLATEGVLYSNARTVAPLTLPAHASMLTGLYPVRHAVRDNSLTPLPDEATTLAEIAAAQGIETAAIVAAAVLDRGLGIAQGFESYEQPVLPSAVSVTTRYPERAAGDVVSRVERWLAGRDRARPFFLWVHFFDPHSPYAPPPEMLERTGGNPYLGEVALVDDAFGAVRSALERDGSWDETLVVVVADHGEGLGDHGEPTHGTLSYDSTLRVPLIVRFPDGRRAGERSDEIVSVVDVFPTVADALALPFTSAVDGLSLYRGRVPEDRGVYFESYYGYLHYGWSPISGFVDRHGKYIHGSTPELYSPRDDPGELLDLADSASAVDRYVSAVAEIAARERLRGVGGVDEELLANLRALGYATGGASSSAELPEPLEATGLPDASERGDELAALFAAMGAAERGAFDEAITGLERVVADNPRNTVARDWLATYLIHRRRCEEAIPLLRSLLASAIETGNRHNSLGHCQLERGNAEEALTHFRRALELEPNNPILPYNIAAALDALGRGAEAERYRARSRAISGER